MSGNESGAIGQVGGGGSGQGNAAPFRRAQFTARNRSLLNKPNLDALASSSDNSNDNSSGDNDDVASLPELVLFNAVHNPDHVFCVETFGGTQGAPLTSLSLSFARLAHATELCAQWILSNVEGSRQANIDGDGNVTKSKPIAIFMESGTGLFVHLLACLTLNIPCVLLSTRLSLPAVRHIVEQTETSCVLVSDRTSPTIDATFADSDESDIPQRVNVMSIQNLLERSSQTINHPHLEACKHAVREDDSRVLILHSSGTTGLPKPIPVAHRYLLGYACCHTFPSETDESTFGMNLSTLPFFHGFGLLGPCLALSVGKVLCLPPASTVANSQLLLEIMRTLPVGMLMTVPTIAEEFTASESFTEDAQDLARLEIFAVGGGQLKRPVASTLASHGIKLLNHFGATELGALAPIFKPDSSYDWTFLRVRSDLDLELKVTDASNGFCSLVGHPFGWTEPMELKDKLIRNPKRPADEVMILGRTDDLIVLANGEKFLPHQMENIIEQHSLVKRAVVFGNGQAEAGVLVEPIPGHGLEAQELVDSIWSSVIEANKLVDQHCRIASRDTMLIKPDDKEIPVSDKGSTQRQETYQSFEVEIDAIYTNLDGASNQSSLPTIDASHPEVALHDLAGLCLPEHVRNSSWADNDDLINLGMDSLQATRLRRMLQLSMRKSAAENIKSMVLPLDFVYAHPTVDGMAQALKGGAVIPSEESVSDLVEKYAQFGDRLGSASGQSTVLITGSTGNLGSNVLKCLCESAAVVKVICLVRSDSTDKASDFHERCNVELRKALDERRTTMSEFAFSKVRYEPWRQGYGLASLSEHARHQIVSEVTHIMHAAWPMDFKRKLASFETQLQALRDLIDIAVDCNQLRPHIKPRLLFTSSISTVARYSEESKTCIVPAASMPDSETAVPMGYARAKWACEQILERAHNKLGHKIEVIILRIGQLSGSSISGHWNEKEHIPQMVQAGRTIRAMPNLKGTVSWLPVDQAAIVTAEIMLRPGCRNLFYQIENPVRQSWPDICTVVERELGLSRGSRLEFSDWLKKSISSGCLEGLDEFFQDDFPRVSSGSLSLCTEGARAVSPTLRTIDAVPVNTLQNYVNSLESRLAPIKSAS